LRGRLVRLRHDDDSDGMRILVVHAWLKGNLGDVLQLTVLLSALQQLKPRVLDLAGFPPRPAPTTGEVLSLADRYIPDHFPWYWHDVPRGVGKIVFEPLWRNRRKAFFSRYDAIVCAPGPYLADYDRRVTSALCDISVGRDVGAAVILSSHSIGPLHPEGDAAVARASVRIAREPATYRYLSDRGMSVVPSADLAFVYPYATGGSPRSRGGAYRLLFLRSNNVDGRLLRLTNGALLEGDRVIAPPSTDPLVLATSDARRDERFVARTASRLGVEWVVCRSVPQLAQLIAGSSAVVSDRYHPAICAATLGKPVQVLPNREPHKMHGLKQLLEDNTVAELQELARTGLVAVCDAIRSET
jgi:polysaccharide pyruvyl transferase WcaK-like protein